MKEKILNQLKTKYSHLGLGDAYLTHTAELLSASGLVTDDNLNDVVDKQSAILEAKQKEDDRLRTEIANLKKLNKEMEEKLKIEKPKKEQKEETKQENKEEEMPKWAEQLREQLEQLQKEKTKADEAKQKAEREASIINIAKELGIPDGRIKQGFVIAENASEEQIKAYLNDIKDYEVSRGLPDKNGLVASSTDEELRAQAKKWVESI